MLQQFGACGSNEHTQPYLIDKIHRYRSLRIEEVAKELSVRKLWIDKRCILIGLDGATFDLLDSLMEQGVMPFLDSLSRSGSRAALSSIIPPLTPPAWTSLVTGRSPGHHGVFDFFQKEIGSAYIRIADRRDIHCDTIWEIADQCGARTTSLNFPLMMPPPPINGNIIAGGWLTRRQLRLACHPDALYKTVTHLPGVDANVLTLDMSHEAKALEGCSEDEYEEWIDFHIAREKQWASILTHLMQEDPCQLTAVLFDGVDKIQHLCWRFLSLQNDLGSLTPSEMRIREHCLAYFSEIDRIIAKIDRLAGPAATLLIVSDHGFGPQVETFFANAWLAENGYLKWADRTAEDRSSGTLGMDMLAKHTYLLDWEHTVAYAATPSSNGIHIVPAGDNHPNGISRQEYASFRKRLIEKLLRIVSPTTGEACISRIYTREEAFPGPYQAHAPDLTLIFHDGGLLSILPSDKLVVPLDTVKGSHRMAGVFMAKGPGIRPQLRMDPTSILSIAPLVLYSLGLEVPADMEGRIPEEIFDPSYLKRYPVTIAKPSAKRPASVCTINQQPLFDAEAKAKMAEKLRALGYID